MTLWPTLNCRRTVTFLWLSTLSFCVTLWCSRRSWPIASELTSSWDSNWTPGGFKYSFMKSLPRLRSSILIPSRSVERSSLKQLNCCWLEKDERSETYQNIIHKISLKSFLLVYSLHKDKICSYMEAYISPFVSKIFTRNLIFARYQISRNSAARKLALREN